MAHFQGEILTVWGQLLPSRYNSPGMKDRPQISRFLPPTKDPASGGTGPGREPRASQGKGFFFSGSLFVRLWGFSSLENSSGLGPG